MARISHQDRVDSLINHFWQNGYLTVSRKYGSYLPSPKPLGNYEVDAIGKYKKKYVIGITLSAEDLDNPKLISKLKYLSSRNTKFSNKKVTLYLGVPSKLLIKANNLINSLPAENKQNIKLVPIPEKNEI